MHTKVTVVFRADEGTRPNRESVAMQISAATHDSSYMPGVGCWQPLEFWIPEEQLDTATVKDCLEAVRQRSDVREVLVEAT